MLDTAISTFYHRMVCLCRLLETKNKNFDIFDCHSVWAPWMQKALVEQAAHPLLRVTTIRDPIEQFVSLYFHLQPHMCNSSLPSPHMLHRFAYEWFQPRIESFYSRPYKLEDLVDGVDIQECHFWDVIWRTDELDSTLNDTLRYNKRGGDKCPTKALIWADEELISVVREETSIQMELYKKLLGCEKVVSERPWQWSGSKQCIVKI